MKVFANIALIASAAGYVVSHPVHQLAPYSTKEAASIARTLVKRESLSQFNTVQQSGTFEGWPVSFVEYYADCSDDGNPFLLLVDMSTDYKNIEAGSKLSLSIKVGDHQLKDQSDPHYPGGIISSTMGSPRVMLTGRLVDATERYSSVEMASVTACYLKRHKDAAFWLPGSKIHSSHWWKFEVEGLYFIGGFGDRAYIGEVPLDEYLNAELLNETDYEATLREMYHGYHHQNLEAHHPKKSDCSKSRLAHAVEEQNETPLEFTWLGKITSFFNNNYF